MKWHRYSGSGNIFLISCSEDVVELSPEEVISLCKDVDGLVFLGPSSLGVGFFRYYNRDGSSAAMCGNGLRCLAHCFAHKHSLSSFLVETEVGLKRVSVYEDIVSVEICAMPRFSMKRVCGVDALIVDTGVVHALVPVASVGAIDPNVLGRKIRYDDLFAPDGVNVTFAEYRKADPVVDMWVRTYEKGVEAETGACGTGVVAAAALFMTTISSKPSVRVRCSSSEKLLVKREDDLLFLEGRVKGCS